MTKPLDLRQRFFFSNAPVRGDLVRLEQNGLLDEILGDKHYPEALKLLMSELCAAAALLASGYKMKGRLSVQLQGSGALNYAMAECSDTGEMRGVAGFDAAGFEHAKTAIDALGLLSNETGQSVIFLNIEPDQGERYQSIVERVSDQLDECLSHYLSQSMQIQSFLVLAASPLGAGGLLLQKLPEDTGDQDAWQRSSVLAKTLKANELSELPVSEILRRLYHEEDLNLPEPLQLRFGCQCSRERTLAALRQLGEQQLNELFEADDLVQGKLSVECRFCGQSRLISRGELRTH